MSTVLCLDVTNIKEEAPYIHRTWYEVPGRAVRALSTSGGILGEAFCKMMCRFLTDSFIRHDVLVCRRIWPVPSEVIFGVRPAKCKIGPVLQDRT